MCLVYAIMMVMLMATAMVLLYFKHDENWAGVADEEVPVKAGVDNQHHLKEDGQVQEDVTHTPYLGAVLARPWGSIQYLNPPVGMFILGQDDVQLEGAQDVEDQTSECQGFSLCEEFNFRFYILFVTASLVSFTLLVVGTVYCQRQN